MTVDYNLFYSRNNDINYLSFNFHESVDIILFNLI